MQRYQFEPDELPKDLLKSLIKVRTSLLRIVLTLQHRSKLLLGRIFAQVSASMGLQWNPNTLAFFTEDPNAFERESPLDFGDLQSLGSRVKRLGVVDFSRGYMFKKKAISYKSKRERRYWCRAAIGCFNSGAL
jgi:hypothetical protein